jgi:hypothetical protein
MKEIKTRKEIKAMSGGLVLLRKGEVPVIGFIDKHQKSLLPDGRLITSTQVVFDYEGNGNKDYFTFYEGILISNSLYGLQDSKFIDRYIKIIRLYKTDLEGFISACIEAYVAYELALD